MFYVLTVYRSSPILQPENVLLNKGGVVKLTGFALAGLFDPSIGDHPANLLHTTCGTPDYIAPEVSAPYGSLAGTWSRCCWASLIPYKEIATTNRMPWNTFFLSDKFLGVMYVPFLAPTSYDGYAHEGWGGGG